MKRIEITFCFLVCLFFVSALSAQCEIKSRTKRDGLLYYSVDPVNFFYTKQKSLSGGIVTDGEYFYLVLHPYPIPTKAEAKKMKDSLEVVMENENKHFLEFSYYGFIQKDTVFEIMYLIGKKELNEFREVEIKQLKINMQGTEGYRTYNFTLHKKAVQEQLKCLIEDRKKSEK